MVRRSYLVAALALVALGAGKPASAHPRFIEPYGRLFQARTFLCTPVDKRPKDALHAWASKLDDPRQRDYVEDGWNITGDTYRKDADGYYWYLARSDDMIVSSGYNIGAPEVENALLSHPAVAECAVIGIPCPERGQKVKAFVVPAQGFAPSEALVTELQTHAKTQIAPYKYPREIEFVEALPKTATGKLRRSELR